MHSWAQNSPPRRPSRRTACPGAWHPVTQAATWAWAGISARPFHQPRPKGSPSGGRSICVVRSYSTAVRHPRGMKTGDGRRSPNPRVHSLPPPFLSHRAAAMGGRGKRAERRHRGLLAGACARRRVSAPPSSRPWTEPCSRAPRARPRRPGAASRRLLCAVKSGERRRKRVPRTGGGSGARTR